MYIRGSSHDDYHEESESNISVLDLDTQDPDGNEIRDEGNAYDIDPSDPGVTVADGCTYLVGGEYEVESVDHSGRPYIQ